LESAFVRTVLEGVARVSRKRYGAGLVAFARIALAVEGWITQSRWLQSWCASRELDARTELTLRIASSGRRQVMRALP
jgi:hypothetical protein